MNKAICVGILALVAVSANANNFVLTSGDGVQKGVGQNFALDFVSSGDGTTLVVKVAIPDSDKASVDLSGCGKGLPSGFTGQCAVAKGNLIMMVYNDQNKLLPKGQVSLGMFAVKYADGIARKLSISSTEVGSPDAVELESSASQ